MESISIKSPAWRYQKARELALQEGSIEIDCPYISGAVNMLKGELCTESVPQSYLLHRLAESNGILCSLLISDLSLQEIAFSIEGTEDLVLWFSKLFFDPSVFFNRLLLKEFINVLPETTVLEKQYKELLMASYNLGPNYVLWKKGLRSKSPLDQMDIASNLMVDSYWRAREHKSFSISSMEARESRSWFPQVIRAIESVNNLKDTGETTIETLRLKLVKQDSTKSLSAINLDEIKG